MIVVPSPLFSATLQISEYNGAAVVAPDGARYDFDSLHFHTPAENTVDGVANAMEMHMVHVSPAGDVAVLGVLFLIAVAGAYWYPLTKQKHKEIIEATETLRADATPNDAARAVALPITVE